MLISISKKQTLNSRPNVTKKNDYVIACRIDDLLLNNQKKET